MVRLAPVALAALALGACVVTPPSRDEWACASDEDCVEGYVCAARAGTVGRTCALRCASDEACGADAACAPNGTCARRCTFAPDATPIEPCPSGLACTRSRFPLGAASRIEGLCGSIPTCTIDGDCPGGMRCVSSDGASLRGLSNLICAPIPTDAGCPSAWIETALGCLPRCDGEGGAAACPAGMACHRGSLVPFGARLDESGCYFGAYGEACRDDGECFVGRCVDVGGGARQCTESCDDARRLFLVDEATADPCPALLDRAGPFGARRVFSCEGAGPSAYCVGAGGVGSGCSIDAAASGCAPGLECRQGVCTRSCASDPECALVPNDANPLASGYCDPATGLCAPRLPEDAPCTLDAECTSGLCAAPIIPIDGYRCTYPRRAATPCTRDAECLSGRCTGSRYGIRVCD